MSATAPMPESDPFGFDEANAVDNTPYAGDFDAEAIPFPSDAVDLSKLDEFNEFLDPSSTPTETTATLEDFTSGPEPIGAKADVNSPEFKEFMEATVQHKRDETKGALMETLDFDYSDEVAKEARKRGLSKKEVNEIVTSLKQRDKARNKGEKLKRSSSTEALAYALSSLNYTRMGNLQSMAEHKPDEYNEFIEEMIMNQSDNLLLKLSTMENPFQWARRFGEMFARWCPGTDPTQYMSDKKTIIFANLMVATGVLPAPDHIAKAAEKNVSDIMSDTKTMAALSAALAPAVAWIPGAQPIAALMLSGGGAAGTAMLAFEQFLGKDIIKGMAAERSRRNEMRETDVKEIPHTIETNPEKYVVDLEKVYEG